MHPRPRKYLIQFGAVAVLGLGLAACAQGTGEPTGETEQPIEESTAAGEVRAPAPEPGHRMKRGFHHDPAKMIEKLDDNKNGTLELAELPDKKRKFLEGADSDKNGSLSVEELTAHRKQMAERHFAMKDDNKDGFWTAEEIGDRRWQKLSVADADKDGKLSQVELETAHREGTLKMGMGRGFHGKRGFHKNPGMFIEKFDANENGSLELSELPERKREKLGAADTNKDQKITSEELEAHFKAKFSERRERFEKRRPDSDLAL
jgi:hypothetical protein